MNLTRTSIESDADVIYEAAFSYNDVFFKADILRRTPASLDINNGTAAAAAWLRMRRESKVKEREILRQQLLLLYGSVITRYSIYRYC
jgi:hypothetical protein